MRIYFGSALTVSGVCTLTVVLTGAMLSAHWRVASQALAAILAYNGFVICVVCVLYNLIVSLMCLSLSFIVFWFLLCFIQSSLATWPAYWATHTTLACE